MDITKLDYIQYLCERKLKELSLDNDPQYVQQLERELTNIDVQDIQGYVIDLIKNKTKIDKHGSLIYYLLDISESDPIKNKIPIRIKKQSSFPDIDSDFSMNEREEVVKYFINRYGSDHVAAIGSYGQMKMKIVMRDIARIFDVDLNDTNEVVKNLGDDVDAMTEEEFDTAIAREPGEDGFRNDLYEIRKYLERYPQVREVLFKLKGQLRHLTKHPAGVVATPTKIDETIPLMRHKGDLITSWVDGITRKDLQSSGFIKFDILGLKTLTIIKEILDLIRLRKLYNKEADFSLESIDRGQITSLLYEEFSSKLPLDGNEVIYDRFRHTDTNGIFQFECIAGDSWIGNYRIRELYRDFEDKSVHKIGCVDLKRKKKVRQTIHAMKEQVKEVYRVTVDHDNKCLESTLVHEYYTPQGFKKLSDLKVGDKVLIDQQRCRTQYYCNVYDKTIDSKGIGADCKKCICEGKRTCKPQVLSQFRFFKKRYVFVPILRIDFVGEKTVYDIGFTNKQHHNYVANGFVVHNSNLMKSLLKEIRPTTFNDITSATALGRPGPLDMGMHHEYAARKNGKSFDFGSPLIERCLKDSFGILVYQEDVMRLCNVVAGFPLDLTDTVRKNLMKSIRDKDAKDKEAKQRKEIHEKFINGCVERGLKAEIAESWWQSCVSFARYGFNKSHAVAYTVLSYQMMWFKIYYPLEFYVVLLTNSLKEKFTDYFSEIMGKNISIVPADINRSKEGFTINGEENSIMFGLGHIMGVGPTVIDVIMRTQPFTSFGDFWEKTSQIKKVGKSAMLALISAHAFDCFGTQNEILERYYKDLRGDNKWERDVDYDDRKYEHEQFVESYSLDWRTKLSDMHKEEVGRLNAKTLTRLTQPKVNMKLTVWGIITSIIPRISKSNKNFYYVILTDSKFNIVKVRLPCYNRRCQTAFVWNHITNKYKKAPVEEIVKLNNIIVGDVETSEYMGRIFIDLLDVCCIGNVYEKTAEQEQRLAKYDEIAKEI